MQKQGVNVHYNCRISDVDFKIDSGGKERWIERIHLETEGGEPKPSIQVRDTDLVFLTIGSIISNASFGAHDRPVDKPAVGSQNLGGAWTLWKKIAARQPDFGRPDQFLRDISQSRMMTFTVTFRGGLFQRKFEWLVERQMGRQSPLPITASPWIMHLHTYRQPLFPDQPRDMCVIWVTALRDNNIGVQRAGRDPCGQEVRQAVAGGPANVLRAVPPAYVHFGCACFIPLGVLSQADKGFEAQRSIGPIADFDFHYDRSTTDRTHQLTRWTDAAPGTGQRLLGDRARPWRAAPRTLAGPRPWGCPGAHPLQRHQPRDRVPGISRRGTAE
ncbi:oleate hydratase [uncultured Thiodictyon sp.]|jgi:hypothetical protein|uniref:oleate hydratase n=1 Tax=uncultured Thiodictyon sp. TaxID=1846217 RepID=UPI0025E55701|nr:oleate hydratase [uncultured Thiodictyon sp.]